MPHPDQITVATANTFFGRTVRAYDGFKPFTNADILLLQEVYTPIVDSLKQHLQQAGFDLIHAGGHFGLAMALRSSNGVSLMPGTVRESVLQHVSKFGIALAKHYSRQKLEYSDRGVLAATFVTAGGIKFTIATTHLPVMTAPRKRAQFLIRLADELRNPYYNDPLILTGDMNHYPGPRSVDHAFWKIANMVAVDMQGKPTWPSKSTGALERKLGRFYAGQLDNVLYRGQGIESVDTQVIDVISDHRAVFANFRLSEARQKP